MEVIDYDYAIPTFKKDKRGDITRIGIRKTNAYCNLKVRGYEDRQSWENLGEKEKSRIRDVVMTRRLGGVYENDVKSSIYRITYLLNNGVWLDRDIDLYPRMANFDFKSKEERNLFKSPLAMKLYFSPSIDKAIATTIYNSTSTKELFKKLNAKDVLEKVSRRESLLPDGQPRRNGWIRALRLLRPKVRRKLRASCSCSLNNGLQARLLHRF